MVSREAIVSSPMDLSEVSIGEFAGILAIAGNGGTVDLAESEALATQRGEGAVESPDTGKEVDECESVASHCALPPI